MAWDPSPEEIDEAVKEGNVEWLASVCRWYMDPNEPGKAADLKKKKREFKGMGDSKEYVPSFLGKDYMTEDGRINRGAGFATLPRKENDVLVRDVTQDFREWRGLMHAVKMSLPDLKDMKTKGTPVPIGNVTFFFEDCEVGMAMDQVQRAVVREIVEFVGADVSKQRAALFEARENMVSHPAHYNGAKTILPDGTAKYEPVKIWRNWYRDAGDYVGCMENALKYILRAPFKGKELEDLKKTTWYLDRAAQIRLEADGDFYDLMSVLTQHRSWTAEEIAKDWGLPTYLYGALQAMENDEPKNAAYAVRMHITEAFGDQIKKGGE